MTTGVSDHYGHAVLVTVALEAGGLPTVVDRRDATALASLMSDLRPAYRHRGLSMRPSPPAHPVRQQGVR
jgi:hypothetical protein